MTILTSAFQTFNDYINGGEPEVKKWFMLGSFRPPMVLVTMYVLFVLLVGPAYMKNRKPFNLRYLMSFYNFGLVIFYCYFLLRGMFFIPAMGFQFFCGTLNIVEQGPVIAKAYEHVWLLYLVKYVELLDTVFLVLSKKFNMITKLHVIHHSVVPIFAYLSIRGENSPYLTVFMGLNSIIHVLMYTYYGIAVLGPQYQKYIWWKRYLTSIQILQFLFMTIYICVMAQLGCINSKFTLYFCGCLTVLFFFLFLDYYRRSFDTSSTKKSSLLKNGAAKMPCSCATNGTLPHSAESCTTSHDVILEQNGNAKKLM